MDTVTRESELALYLQRQPYQVEQDGITLTIAKNVFPSDFGLTSSFFGRHILQQTPVNSALDMGCGSGYFAFLLKKIGCEAVIGADFNADAVQCALANRELNPDYQPDDILHSDLFKAVPANTFGLIVFNFNYHPSNGVFGLYEDGGRVILERFFTEVLDYIDHNTKIFIPYSAFVGKEHDPWHIAPKFGFSVTLAAETENAVGRHFIYLIVLS